MCGPPGNGSPSSRATLSNASPAASSMVAPIGSTPVGDVLDPQQAGVAAADQHRQARLGQRPVLELVDGDVRGEVVDAVDRLAEPERQRLGGGDADHQRAGQAGAAGDRDRVDVVEPDAGGLAGPLDGRHHRLEVRAAGDLRARRRRSGRARRRCSRPRRRAGCGRGRSRHRSRRRTSRCRGSGVRCSPAHCADRAYAAGVTPSSRRKCRVRCAWSWKPTATATSAARSPASSSSAGPVEPASGEVAVRRDAELAPERPDQVGRVRAERRGRLGERDALDHPGVEQVAEPVRQRPVRAYDGGRCPRAGAGARRRPAPAARPTRRRPPGGRARRAAR